MSDTPWNLAYFREPDPIAAPVALPATMVTDEDFVANWDGVDEAVGYELEVSTSPTFSSLFGGGPISVPGLSYSVPDIEPETVYYYRVRSLKASGTLSAASNVIELETLELFAAQGGDLVTYDGEYSRHYFNNNGDFEVVTGERRVRRLISGGGGMGGGVNGSGVSCGGGGGGGVLDLQEEVRDPLGVGVYPVVVGAGGSVPGVNNVGQDGFDSSFEGDVAEGGGHGGSAGASVGNGGSGGGAVNSAGTEFGGLGVPGQGYDGGDANAGSGGGAGGGGAAEPGENGTGPKGGDGGDGLESDISGEVVRYGAGGGGAVRIALFEAPGLIPGAGGAGGGAPGSTVSAAGPAATGIGAGGGGTFGNNPGGAGKKGQVVLKYRGRALDITEEEEEEDPVDPPAAMWRGPILGPGVIDGVTIELAHFAAGPGAGEMHSTDNPVLGQKHTPGPPNSFAHGFPYPAYYAGNEIGFKFSHEIRRFRITHKNANGSIIRNFIYAADTGGEESFYGEGYAANGGVSSSGSKYQKFFGVGANNRQEVAWVSGDSFKVVVVGQNQAAWGDGSGGWPDAMATVPDTYYEAYFLLASDVEAPDEDLWEPP